MDLIFLRAPPLYFLEMVSALLAAGEKQSCSVDFVGCCCAAKSSKTFSRPCNRNRTGRQKHNGTRKVKPRLMAGANPGRPQLSSFCFAEYFLKGQYISFLAGDIMVSHIFGDVSY